jgi:protein involved in polysaccharide export with SLBB domain
MKLFAINPFRAVGLAGCICLAFVLTGCGSTHYDSVNPQTPFVFPGQSPAPATVQTHSPDPATPSPALPQAPVTYPAIAVNPNQFGGPSAQPASPSSSGVLRAGDLVRVMFSDIPQPPQPIEIRVPEDGRITLPYNITVIATGKSVSQLQEEIRNAYVPKYYVRLTVNIKTEERFYFVGGEVKAPARQIYFGEGMTVLRAIDSVGGFTDFANRKKIELRRADGKVYKVDWSKAIKNANLDLPVYPNDHITVPRRIF